MNEDHPLSLRGPREVIGESAVSCAFSPTGELLACSLENGTLSIINVVEGAKYGPVTMLGAGRESRVAFLGPAAVLHTVGNPQEIAPETCIAALDLEKGKYTRTFSGHATPVQKISTSLLAESFVSSAQSGPVLTWDMRQRAPARSIPSGEFAAIEQSPDGRMLVVVFEQKGEIRLFDTRACSTGPYSTKKLSVHKLKKVQTDFEGQHLLAVCKGELLLVNPFSGEVLARAATEKEARATFSGDGRYVLHTSGDSEVSVALAQTLRKIGGVQNRAENTDTEEIGAGEADTRSEVAQGRIKDLVFNPRYSQLAVVSDRVSLWQ